MDTVDFASAFAALTGNAPFPWQQALYLRFREGRIPASCNLPTGLGKTSVIPIWLIALAADAAGVPRRLVYVVNRRTVVDQATREAENLRDRLSAADRPAVLARLAATLSGLAATFGADPLAISTLRGRFADNGEWWKDPARPAVVVGTTDLIGGRLLFSGRGAGFQYRPLYAGLLGQDALIVHDEAHLEPAFQRLLCRIEDEQNLGRFDGGPAPRDLRPVRVMELTAASRGAQEPFGLAAADEQNATIKRRIGAKKGVGFHAVDDEKQTAPRVAELALRHRDSGQAVLVFLRRLQDVTKVADRLRKAAANVRLLTGAMRGRERDRLVRDGAFARFLPPSDRPADGAPTPGTVYLVCTSAGEVGVNMSADHLVCDLVPFDGMAQRLGRVNRFGEGDARIDVVHPAAWDGGTEYEGRRRKTLALLQTLPRRDDGRREAGPSALGALPPSERQAAFTPPPEIPYVGDILFDAWALTSVRGRLPGRPPAADWLHGVDEGSPPETCVAWREEVELFGGAGLSDRELAEILADYPLKPQELLRDSTERVVASLQKLAQAGPTLPVWLLPEDGDLERQTLHGLVGGRAGRLADATVILPPSAGGLTEEGTLGGPPGRSPQRTYDVADEPDDRGGRFRARKTTALGAGDRPPAGWRLARGVLLLRHDDEDEIRQASPQAAGATAGPMVRLFFVRARFADDQGSTTASEEQGLADHHERTARAAEAMAKGLELPPLLRKALTLAARWHDLGKGRAVWQRSVGNGRRPKRILAKSGAYGPLQDRTGYRHEFGSLIDATEQPGFKDEPEEVKELVLHLIAAHHGRGRPHFDAEEAFDPTAPEAACERVASEVPGRYARLQRRYGRWGLAWLESLLRAADACASARPTESGS